jgi:hypothetical protein
MIYDTFDLTLGKIRHFHFILERRTTMKKLFSVLFALVLLATFSLYQAAAVKTQEEPSVEVKRGLICRDVQEREPVGDATEFEAAVGKLFCYTEIVGAEMPIEITHVWYYHEAEMARVNLQVEGARWRTWSIKIIMAKWIGSWHVDVIGPNGEVLKTIDFEIKE